MRFFKSTLQQRLFVDNNRLTNELYFNFHLKLQTFLYRFNGFFSFCFKEHRRKLLTNLYDRQNSLSTKNLTVKERHQLYQAIIELA